MSAPTQQDTIEQEQARALEEAIEKALDFSEIHESIERIEQMIAGLK